MITNSNDQKSPSCSMFTYLPPIDPCLVQKYNLSYHLYILSVSTNIKPDLCVLEPLYKTIDVRIFIFPEKIIHDPFNHRKLLLLCVPTGNVSSSFIHHLYKSNLPRRRVNKLQREKVKSEKNFNFS